jgi:hypothetical protein
VLLFLMGMLLLIGLATAVAGIVTVVLMLNDPPLPPGGAGPGVGTTRCPCGRGGAGCRGRTGGRRLRCR